MGTALSQQKDRDAGGTRRDPRSYREFCRELAGCDRRKLLERVDCSAVSSPPVERS